MLLSLASNNVNRVVLCSPSAVTCEHFASCAAEVLFVRVCDNPPSRRGLSKVKLDFRASQVSAAPSFRSRSVPAARNFDDNSLDFVFIDGEHRYESFQQDQTA